MAQGSKGAIACLANDTSLNSAEAWSGPTPLPRHRQSRYSRHTMNITGVDLTARLVTRLAHARARAGLGPRDDAWRALARTQLRTEASKFGLAAFGLAVWPEGAGPPAGPEALMDAQAQVAGRLVSFLRTRPEVRWRLEWRPTDARRVPADGVDLTVARFAPDGRLEAIRAMLDVRPRLQLGVEARARLDAAIVRAYNETRAEADLGRPGALQRRVAAETTGDAVARRYVRRVLSGTFVSFGLLDGPDTDARWAVPDFLGRKHPGLGVLNVHARLLPDLSQVDLWLQIHHVPVDGAPMQELLTALRAAWGSPAPPPFPAPPRGPDALAWRASTPDHDDSVFTVLDFADFRPLLALRRALAGHDGAAEGGPVPIPGLLAWCLAHHPRFAGDSFAVPTDLAAVDGLQRSVALAVARPGRFMDAAAPDGGLAAYAADFRREVAQARARAGRVYRAFHYYALIPPAIQARIAGRAAARASELGGSVGITVLKDAEVFIAPISPVYRCYIGLGNLRRPTAGGGEAGAVSMKLRDRADWHALCDVLAAPHRYGGVKELGD
jgi:hypothetical protein